MTELSRYNVEAWIRMIATGEFHYTKVLDGTVNIKKLGGNLRKIMYDICHAENPICEAIGRRDGYYRPIQEDFETIDWQNAKPEADSPIVLPFDLRKYVFIYPKSVIVVAGSKSSGKTGFLMRTVVLNMNKMNVVFLSRMEGGRGMMLDRFSAMDIEIPNPAPFKVKKATDNFHDAIKEPKTLYVVDYIDAPEGTDFYLIGAAITKIQNKLDDDSVAAIGLQKPFGRDLAFGKEQTLKDAALYIVLDSNKLKILDAKKPSPELAQKHIHPKNMAWTFQYEDEGTKFINIQKSYEEA